MTFPSPDCTLSTSIRRHKKVCINYFASRLCATASATVGVRTHKAANIESFISAYHAALMLMDHIPTFRSTRVREHCSYEGGCGVLSLSSCSSRCRPHRCFKRTLHSRVDIGYSASMVHNSTSKHKHFNRFLAKFLPSTQLFRSESAVQEMQCL